MPSLFEHCRGEKTWCETQRFLCIDNTVYHIGASLKDLGNRWFSFNKMEMTAKELLGNVK